MDFQDLAGLLLFVAKVLGAAVGAWIINVPLCAMAYKVRHGYPPVPFEWREFGWRSALAALGMTLLASPVFVVWRVYFLSEGGLDWRFALLALGFLIAVGPWLMSWAFALDDWFAGLSVFAMYFCMPTVILFVVWLIAGSLADLARAIF